MDKQAHFVPPTMAVPPPGFTARVMARIEQHERAKERRRTIVGAAVLLGAASLPFMSIAYLVALVGSQLWADPGSFLSALLALSPVVDVLVGLVDALTIGASTLFRVGSIQMFFFAVLVCALTFIWAYVVRGTLQFAPRTLSVGGPR